MIKPQTWRKLPVEVQVLDWAGDTESLTAFVGTWNWGRADVHNIAWEHEDSEQVVIWNEPEKSWLPLPITHFVIRGVLNEFYPCDPDAFRQTYELA